MINRHSLKATAPTVVMGALGAYHNNIVTMLDSIAVKTPVDVGIALRFTTFAGKTFTPPAERIAVIESLGRLRSRLVPAEHSDLDTLEAVKAVDAAVTALAKQPDKMPSNGHAESGRGEEIPAGGFKANIEGRGAGAH